MDVRHRSASSTARPADGALSASGGGAALVAPGRHHERAAGRTGRRHAAGPPPARPAAGIDTLRGRRIGGGEPSWPASDARGGGAPADAHVAKLGASVGVSPGTARRLIAPRRSTPALIRRREGTPVRRRVVRRERHISVGYAKRVGTP